MKKILIATFFTAIAFSASFSFAYKLERSDSGAILHWPAEAFPVQYRITNRPPIGADAFTQAVQMAFNTWQAVNNATITFQYTGSTDSREPALDGSNNIIMKSKVTGSDVVGQSYIYYYVSDGKIVECDIVLNASYPWGTDGAANKMDVQNVLTHEIGHLCCLDDLYDAGDSEKTMYGYIDYGETKKRTLDPDDAAGLAAVYSQGSPDEGDSGGGSSGCGTLSSTQPPPGPYDINFLWLFLLLLLLGSRRFLRPRAKLTPQ